MALLNEKFPGRIISRNSEVNWPPRSCDLTPLDFFLWGYLKSKVYANKPTTVQQLKDEIRRHIGEMLLLLLLLLITRSLPMDGGMAEDHGAPEAGQLPRVWTRGHRETESRQRVSGVKSP